MSDLSDLRFTIVPKSDQLNSEQLLSGPMTITITSVSIGSDEQPLIVHHDKDRQRPFKPCKTMRKLMIFAWGEDGHKWAGHSMTLYNDKTVRFGGAEVGGIRISHMTGINGLVKLDLTATKGKKTRHIVEPLIVERPVDEPPPASEQELMQSISAAGDMDQLRAAFKTAYRSTKDQATSAKYKAAYDLRTQALTHAEEPAETHE